MCRCGAFQRSASRELVSCPLDPLLPLAPARVHGGDAPAVAVCESWLIGGHGTGLAVVSRWRGKGANALRQQAQQVLIQIILQVCQPKGVDAFIHLEILQPPVGSHLGAAEAQQVVEAGAHRLKIEGGQAHLAALVQPIADQPVHQPAGGDEVATVTCLPVAAAFP